VNDANDVRWYTRVNDTAAHAYAPRATRGYGMRMCDSGFSVSLGMLDAHPAGDGDARCGVCVREAEAIVDPRDAEIAELKVWLRTAQEEAAHWKASYMRREGLA
jgi:hypothetical protein